MNDIGYKNIQRRFLIFAYILLAAQIIVCLCFGAQKKGFHEDEYYSYYSSNRTAGFFVPDREWQDTSKIRDEYVVKVGQGFNYPLVREVQSWDVHPPMYYYILHTACSILPELFSKWLGIGVNLVAFVLAWWLLLRLMNLLQIRKRVQLAILALWGFHPMTISFVMFTRMYMWLTVFVVGCAYLHIRLLQTARVLRTEHKLLSQGHTRITGTGIYYYVKYILPIMVCSYLGFLTHYYYLIFFFYMGFLFTLWVLFFSGSRKKKEGEKKFEVTRRRLLASAVYVISCAVSLGLAVLSYPAAAAHIFRGYRGTEALGAFAESANTLSRLGFFGGLLNGSVFGGTFYILAVIIVVSYIVMKIYVSSEYLMLTGAVAGYFLTVAKTALLLGDTSNRYEMPVYGLIIMIVISAIEQVGYEASLRFEQRFGKTGWNFHLINECVMICLGVLFGLWISYENLVADKVLFLYREAGARVAFAEEASENDIPAVVLYNSNRPDTVGWIWWISEELMEYPKLYYVNEENDEAITDSIISEADQLVVYAADDDNQEKCLQLVMDANPNLSSYEKIDTSECWTIYSFQ